MNHHHHFFCVHGVYWNFLWKSIICLVLLVAWISSASATGKGINLCTKTQALPSPHGHSSGCASMHWCGKQRKNWKYGTTKFLSSRTCTPIPLLPLSNESLMLPFFLIIETKQREDNKDFLFVSFPSLRFGSISPGIVDILQMWFSCSFGSFHSTSPNIHQGTRGTTSERGRPTRTCPYGDWSVATVPTSSRAHTNAEQLKMAQFEETWPKVV